MRIKKYATVDIGSNAIRLLIMHAIEHSKGTHFKKASLVRVPIRFGQDVFVKGEIQERNEERLIESLKAFKSLIIAHEVDAFRACATSAMRDAKNGESVVERVASESGIRIEVIDGKEEADLIYGTHIENILDDKNNYLYIDVGGGSTEMTLFVAGKVEDSKSFDIGTIRLLNGLVEQEEWDEMRNWLLKHEGRDKLQAIGSGGNINRIYKMNMKSNWKPLLREELAASAALIESMDYEERLIKLNMNIDRADVVLHASNIFLNVTKWANIEKIHVPKMGLADGLVRKLHEAYLVNKKKN